MVIVGCDKLDKRQVQLTAELLYPSRICTMPAKTQLKAKLEEAKQKLRELWEKADTKIESWKAKVACDSKCELEE